jgi:hypothetical protein
MTDVTSGSSHLWNQLMMPCIYSLQTRQVPPVSNGASVGRALSAAAHHREYFGASFFLRRVSCLMGKAQTTPLSLSQRSFVMMRMIRSFHWFNGKGWIGKTFESPLRGNNLRSPSSPCGLLFWELRVLQQEMREWSHINHSIPQRNRELYLSDHSLLIESETKWSADKSEVPSVKEFRTLVKIPDSVQVRDTGQQHHSHNQNGFHYLLAECRLSWELAFWVMVQWIITILKCLWLIDDHSNPNWVYSNYFHFSCECFNVLLLSLNATSSSRQTDLEIFHISNNTMILILLLETFIIVVHGILLVSFDLEFVKNYEQMEVFRNFTFQQKIRTIFSRQFFHLYQETICLLLQTIDILWISFHWIR